MWNFGLTNSLKAIESCASMFSKMSHSIANPGYWASLARGKDARSVCLGTFLRKKCVVRMQRKSFDIFPTIRMKCSICREVSIGETTGRWDKCNFLKINSEQRATPVQNGCVALLWTVMNRLANGVRTYSSIVQAQFQNGGTRFGSGFNNLCKATAAVFQKII